MQEQTVRKINIKIPLYLLTGVIMVFLFFIVGSAKADAKTITITTPEQLVDINWANKGFGPGNTYVIGNDMTLGDGEYATCLLTKGKFVIDFNGHTVQNASPYNTVFKISGASVTMMDSKASTSKPSVRSYGQGAVQITAGNLLIKNGVYYGASNGQNNPMGLHVGGGNCVVNGGCFIGDYVGASSAGGNFYINGGTFQGGFPFALMSMGGNIKITKGNFISGQTNYGYCFALGAYCQQQYYDFSSWFVDGYNINPGFYTYYWNMQSQVSQQPFLGSTYAVSYNGSTTMSVTNSAVTPPRPAINKIVTKGTTLAFSWNKTARTNGYIVQLSTNKNFTTGVKTVTITSPSKLSATFKNLKKNTMYYFRVRSYRKFNGGNFMSGWSTGGYNPTAPTIKAIKSNSAAIGLSWTKTAGACRYRVFRKTGSGSWTKLGDTNNNSYIDKTAKKGVTYQYAVRAISANGKAFLSPASAAKSMKR